MRPTMRMHPNHFGFAGRVRRPGKKQRARHVMNEWRASWVALYALFVVTGQREGVPLTIYTLEFRKGARR